MKKYDVVALGELLIDFTQTDIASRATRFLRQIQEELPAMFLPCCRSLGVKQRLSVRLDEMALDSNLKRH